MIFRFNFIIFEFTRERIKNVTDLKKLQRGYSGLPRAVFSDLTQRFQRNDDGRRVHDRLGHEA